MKKVILIILGIIVTLGVLGGAGFAGYRFGYRQGLQANPEVVIQRFDRLPKFDQNSLPPNHPDINGRNFDRGIMPDRFPMMQRGGFNFFPPFQFLWRLVILGLFIWLGYQLFKGNGWHLSLTRNSPTAKPVSLNEESAQSDG